jgi:hypothetical protein
MVARHKWHARGSHERVHKHNRDMPSVILFHDTMVVVEQDHDTRYLAAPFARELGIHRIANCPHQNMLLSSVRFLFRRM